MPNTAICRYSSRNLLHQPYESKTHLSEGLETTLRQFNLDRHSVLISESDIHGSLVSSFFHLSAFLEFFCIEPSRLLTVRTSIFWTRPRV